MDKTTPADLRLGQVWQARRPRHRQASCMIEGLEGDYVTYHGKHGGGCTVSVFVKWIEHYQSKTVNL